MTNPYASFDAYWAAGWRGILPLPYGKKTYPPSDYTGYSGGTPSYPDCQAWSEEGNRNLCLRLPDGSVGIDVDHYDGKTGGDTLSGLVAKYGALPPTAYSTSRGDGISGIRLYRVPAGTTLPTKLPGIEFIQRHHRYVVAWPSVHPSGNVYRWIDERTGQTLDSPPRLADLPMLPAAWIEGLAVEARNYEKVDLDAEEASAILAGLPDGEPCQHILAHAGKAMSGGDRHDSYNESALAVLGAGRRGCPGARPILARLRAGFIAEVTSPGTSGRRSLPEAEAEWRRGILGALAIVASEEQGTVCPDEVYEWIEDINSSDEQPETEPPEPSPFDRAVKHEANKLRVLEAARDMLAAHRLGQAPPLIGHDLPTFLAQPDEGERYRVARMWPSEGRVLMPAAAKSGKTTLIVGNLIPSLADGTQFLGTFDVEPVTRRIVYFNLEVGERTLRAWARRAGITASGKVTIVNLRGKVAALGLNSESGRKRLADFLRGQDAEIAILDPLAPALAAFGLDENSNSDVATFFAWWSEALGAAGVVDDLIAHHAGHAGERSRGASRLLDEPDAIWTMTKAAGDADDDDPYAPSEIRSLKAIGRDVELAESTLLFDAATGRLTLTGESRRVATRHRTDARIKADILTYLDDNEGCIRQDVKDGVTGKSAAIGKILNDLIATGEVAESHENGRYRLFRSHHSPKFPERGNDANTTVPRSPSLDGNGNGTGNGTPEGVQQPPPAATPFPRKGNGP